jgi:hypothetical protein
MKKTVKKQNEKKPAAKKAAAVEKTENSQEGNTKAGAKKIKVVRLKPETEKPVKEKPAKHYTKACILLACTSGGSAIEEQVNFQWSVARLYARIQKLEQTFEMTLATARDSKEHKTQLSEILRQIRTLKLGGVVVENVVVSSQHKLNSNPDLVFLFVRKLTGKGIRVHFVNDSVLPPHLQKLKAGLTEIRQAYQYALELWFESVNR